MYQSLVQQAIAQADKRALSSTLIGSRILQRKCDKYQKKQALQRSAFELAPDSMPPIVHEVISSPGQPLDRATLSFMEPRFGHDFSRVRVHTDDRAAESTRSVNALAYTVGQDIVFGKGQYSPGTYSGRRLLVHELTHVLQQSSENSKVGDLSSENKRHILARSGAETREEIEADRAVEAVILAGAAPHVSGAPVGLQKEAAPSSSDEERDIRIAEFACDIPTLCRLRRRNPTLVTDRRIRSVARRCRPNLLITMDPCLMPAFMLSSGALATSSIPTRTPGATQGTSAPAAGETDVLGTLEQFTNFSFHLGPAQFVVELPSSVTMRLPVPLRGARTLEFAISAGTSRNFSLSIYINGLRHVRIEATAGAEFGESSRRATGGLTISTTRTVCRAMEPSTACEQLLARGEQLRSAILNLQSSRPAEPGAERIEIPERPVEPPATTAEQTEMPERLADVASAILDLYEVVERAQARCVQVPVATFGITGFIGEEEGESRWQAGATLTLHF